MDSLKAFIKLSCLVITLLNLCSCQMGYIFNSAIEQFKILNHRVPIDDALNDPSISEAEKAKLKLSKNVRIFAEKDLGLNVKKNYTTYVKLNRPYVSYVVSAAPKWKLETYHWYFPIVGRMPYKGFFNEEDAKKLASEMKANEYDVYVRGVSAYSTLGWFKDPLLSSMMSYKEHDLVNTIIHESVHATLFIKNEANFNERMAVFLGNKGMERFYLQLEGQASKTLELIKYENHDDAVFSNFITQEIRKLEDWFQKLPESERNEESRTKKFNEIKTLFAQEVKPKLKSNSWLHFEKIELNNARLVVFKTYLQDLNDFEKLYSLVQENFEEFLKACQKLENHKNPNQGLKDLIVKLEANQKQKQ